MFLYPNIPYFHHFHHSNTKKILKTLCINISLRYRYKKILIFIYWVFDFLAPSTLVFRFDLALLYYCVGLWVLWGVGQWLKAFAWSCYWLRYGCAALLLLVLWWSGNWLRFALVGLFMCVI